MWKYDLAEDRQINALLQTIIFLGYLFPAKVVSNLGEDSEYPT